jgi:uncharacterized protein (TIGR03067 family)
MFLSSAGLLLTAGLALAGQPDKGKAPAELQGTWKLVGVEADGEMLEFPPNLPRWVIKGTKVRYGGGPLADLTVDPKANPKVIDLEWAAPKRTYEGIYQVEGDTLKLCVNAQSDGVKERPGDFTTEGKAGRRLLVFERVKDGDGTDSAPGFVGVQIRKNEDDKGVVVVDTIPDSPARKAGLKKDDLILQVGGKDLSELKEVIEAVRQVRPGTDLTIRVRRDDKEMDVRIRVGFMPFFMLGN